MPARLAGARQAFGWRKGEGVACAVRRRIAVLFAGDQPPGLPDYAVDVHDAVDQAPDIRAGDDAGRKYGAVGQCVRFTTRARAAGAAPRPPAARQAAGAEEAGLGRPELMDDQPVVIVAIGRCGGAVPVWCHRSLLGSLADCAQPERPAGFPSG
ncbi:hypothetical protein B5M44_18340 [Shinella sumterensis]|uniref:hypothetical protein n=1 Tax=Shinella sumterensis TaxID=1967501 RepID=UPI00106E2FD8|nr:hypothetical protein [Shinella sumterensis]MCD1266475.1 hypothetical protein [Shinella sumterensis]TFE96701.1 hypothetical protein B5M44_18340 [Shinella sumterensis]